MEVSFTTITTDEELDQWIKALARTLGYEEDAFDKDEDI